MTSPRTTARVLALFSLASLAACSQTPTEPGPSDGEGGKAAGGRSGSGGSGPSGSGGSGNTGNGGNTGAGGSSNAGSGGRTGGGGNSGSGSGGQTGGGNGGQSGGGNDAGAGMGGATGAGGQTGGGSDAGADPGAKFSFFATSLAGLQKLSKNEKGFGGDLRYGQADGISGADKICTELAEASMPGSGAKGWRAFLSAEKGPMGTPVNGIDRVGEGPWFDRKGRLLANNKMELLNPRPINADPAIKNDFPNEFGVNNSRPNPAGKEEDNHHFLTGSDASGKLKGINTCDSWTTTMTTPDNHPQTGFSFVIANRRHWIYGQIEGGCGPGVSLGPTGPANQRIPLVSSGGGYGGFYCFALKP